MLFTAAAMRNNIMTLGMTPHSRLGEEKRSATTVNHIIKNHHTHLEYINIIYISIKMLFQSDQRWNYKTRLSSELLVVISLEN